MSARRTLMNVAVQVVTIVGPPLFASMGAGAYAQDLEPRAFVNTPVGLNFLLAGYGYAAGGVATDPSLPLQNANLQVHSALLAYARSLDVWGKSGKIDVVVPYAWLSGSTDFQGQPREREVSGFADPRFQPIEASLRPYSKEPLRASHSPNPWDHSCRCLERRIASSAPRHRPCPRGLRGAGGRRVGVCLVPRVGHADAIHLLCAVLAVVVKYWL